MKGWPPQLRLQFVSYSLETNTYKTAHSLDLYMQLTDDAILSGSCAADRTHALLEQACSKVLYDEMAHQFAELARRPELSHWHWHIDLYLLGQIHLALCSARRGQSG